MNDRRTQTSLPDGTSWRYGYDRLSQVVSGERVNTDGTPVQDGSFRYEYDGIGNRTFSQDGAPNAIRRYSSNALNQYTAVAATGFIPLGGRADEDANVVVTATVDGRSETYLPDRDGQEFSVDIPVDNSRGAVTATVRVDALKPGHGQQASDLHRSLAGEYTVAAAVPETPSYDADGNMLTNGGWTYAWNAQDRLVSAAKGATRLEFAYDYMGRRFEKKVYENNVLTKRSLYAYDGFKQIAEYDALDNNALLNTYIWQPEGLDVPLLRNGSEFYVSDANKNVVALMDTTGAVTDTYLYAPFGACVHTGSSPNPFRFSSEYHDDETDLVYYNYRYYLPELGRWTKRDPIGEDGGVNLYALCSNELLFYFDYLGLRRLKLFYDLENMQNPYFSGISIARDKYGNYEGLLNDGFTFLPEKRGDYFRHTEEILTDMKKRVVNYSPSGEGDCNCIEHIQFAQHGGPGILRFGEEALDSSTLEQWEKKYVAYKYPVNDSEKMDAYNGKIHLEAEDKDFTFYSILSRISALLCKEGKVYVDFIQCYAAAGTNGNALRDYLETFFNENVTVTVYRDKAYLLRGKPVQKDYWDRFGKPVKERSLAH